MARKQTLTAGATRTAGAGVATQLSLTSLKVVSVEIQALNSNSDLVYVGDSSGQLRAVTPGNGWTIWGDNVDHGVQCYVDLSEIYFRPVVAGEGVTYTYLLGY